MQSPNYKCKLKTDNSQELFIHNIGDYIKTYVIQQMRKTGKKSKT